MRWLSSCLRGFGCKRVSSTRLHHHSLDNACDRWVCLSARIDREEHSYGMALRGQSRRRNVAKARLFSELLETAIRMWLFRSQKAGKSRGSKSSGYAVCCTVSPNLHSNVSFGLVHDLPRLGRRFNGEWARGPWFSRASRTCYVRQLNPS